MSDSIEKLRAWVAEVEARHQETGWDGESYCADCQIRDGAWPCDAVRGVAVVRAMLRPYRGHSDSCFCGPCVGQDFSFDAGASALEGK
jgi:hypothetical protein